MFSAPRGGERVRAPFIIGAIALVAVACSGGGAATASPTSTPAAPSAPVATISVTSKATATPAATTAATATPTRAPAPTGTAATWGADSRGVPFPPPDFKGVNQAAVTAAPAVGPFKINVKAGPAGWPEACDLTSAAQLQALDPEITGLVGTPVGRKGQILGGGLTPKNAGCKWSVVTKTNDGKGVASYVDISLFEVDSGASATYQKALAQHKATAAQYPTLFASYQNMPGGTSCFYDGNALECLKGNVNFWIAGLSFSNGATDHVHWINDILLPLAEKLGYEIQ